MEINATNDDSYGKLILDKDGVAEITVLDENNELNQYEAKIEDLSENNVNITVLDDDNEIVEEYDDEDDLLVDEYECQAAVTVGVISVTTLLQVLLAITACIVIAGITYYAVSTVQAKIAQDKKKKQYYYPACLKGKDVYIAYNKSISSSAASNRIRSGMSIYTYTSSLARTAVSNAGYGVIGPEIDSKKNMKKGYIYYKHYHTGNRNGAHAWYGVPYTA